MLFKLKTILNNTDIKQTSRVNLIISLEDNTSLETVLIM